MRCQYSKVKKTCDRIPRIVKIVFMIEGYSKLVYLLLTRLFITHTERSKIYLEDTFVRKKSHVQKNTKSIIEE